MFDSLDLHLAEVLQQHRFDSVKRVVVTGRAGGWIPGAAMRSQTTTALSPSKDDSSAGVDPILSGGSLGGQSAQSTLPFNNER